MGPVAPGAVVGAPIQLKGEDMFKRHRMLDHHWICLSALVLGLVVAVTGQETQRGPTTVRSEVRHDVSPPLGDMIRNAPRVSLQQREAQPVRRIPLPAGMAPRREDSAWQRTIVPLSPVVSQSFEGLGQGQFGFSVTSAPPDTDGAVGDTQYVQWVNTSFAIFNKSTGALIAGPTAGNTLWSGFGGGCQTNNDGDVVALYDKLAKRWVMSQFSVSTTPYLQCIAVSTTSDATGTWNRYSFQYTDFDDYPKMGVWPDAYYETFNMFAGGTTFAGADACAYNRTAMLAGQPATQVCFQQSSSVGGLLPADFDGTTPPPAGSPNYLMYFGTNNLNLYKFHVDFTTPSNSTFTGPTVINVSAFTPLCNGGTCVPQPGTTNTVDSLADRLMFRLAYRNFGSHESLVVNHSVTANGVGGVRWYEIQSPGSTPVVAQQGTFAPDSTYRWMGSVAMDQAGDLVVGYSKSSSTVFPSIAFAGRTPTDPAGTLETETNVVSGTGSQTGTLTRWGDYSAMTVDPVDDCTFWYTQEYIKTNGTFNWNTRIANFKFSSCGSSAGTVTLTPASVNFGNQTVNTPSSLQPVTLTNNQSTSLTISSVAASGDYSQTNNCGASIPANSTCTINVVFTPTTTGTRTGTLTVTDNGPGSPQSASLTGVGVAAGSVTLSPTSLNFGNQTVGTPSTAQSVTLTNSQSASLTISSIAVSGDYSQTNNCGTSVPGNGSCTINVVFTPTATGTRTGTLTVTDNGPGSPQTASLTGVGVAAGSVTLSPTSLNFGNQTVGTASSAQSVTLTNSQSASLTISSIAVSGDYSQTNNCATSIPANGSCTISVVFTPTTTGTRTGTLTVTDNGPGSPQTASLTGVGVQSSSCVTGTLSNGGFETGDLSCWTAGGAYPTSVVTTRKHSGSYSAQLSSTVEPEPMGDSFIYQTITIPSTAKKATLTFWYWPSTADTIRYDWQEAQVQNSSGTKLAQIMKVDSNSHAWTKKTFDLTPYKGQTIRLYFNVHDDGYGDLTYMYLDDVSVAIQ